MSDRRAGRGAGVPVGIRSGDLRSDVSARTSRRGLQHRRIEGSAACGPIEPICGSVWFWAWCAEWMQHWDADTRRGIDTIFDSSVCERSAVDKVAESLQLRGPAMSVSAACASGNHALAHAQLG